MHIGLARGLTFNGFLYWNLIKEEGLKPFQEEYLPLVREGKIKATEHKTYGLDKIDQALLDVLKGRNLGKAVVVIDEEFDKSQAK